MAVESRNRTRVQESTARTLGGHQMPTKSRPVADDFDGVDAYAANCRIRTEPLTGAR
jgi:hypothetical protein